MQALQALQAQLGDKGLITDPAEMARYLDDPLGTPATLPRMVLRPATTVEVQAAMRWCHAQAIAVIPQGGLTGLTRGAAPHDLEHTAILSLSRMTRIRALDAAGATMSVDAGAVLGTIRATAEAADLYFPLFHGAVGSSQIGGNLSTNAGGNNALRYGTARDQVLGLEVVLPDGTLWDGMRALRKNTAGYDLRQMFIGAEGTLGIITGAVLKLRPAPRNRATAFVAVDSPTAALQLLHLLSRHLGETIAAFELMSEGALAAALALEGCRYPLAAPAPWAVLMEAETPAMRHDLAAALEDGLAEAFEAALVQDAVISQNDTQRAAFWDLREGIAGALIEDKSCLKSDTAVPVSQVPAYMENTARAVSGFLPGIRPVPFGHLGDGNVHFNLLRPEDMAPDIFRGHWHALTVILAQEAMKLGGTLSAEHGIGRLKRAEFEALADPVALDLMRRLRRAMDPAGRMNPGAIFSS
ncbi:FAD-binding oxidoreductase [Phaeovulum sp. W22_SRMD_FR3]